jgi:hypothetical protein
MNLGISHNFVFVFVLEVLSYVGAELMQMKPAIRMAYKASRGVDPSDNEYEACFVDFKEFRILLVNIR